MTPAHMKAAEIRWSRTALADCRLVNRSSGALGAQRLHRFNGLRDVSHLEIRYDCPGSWMVEL